MSDLLVLCYHAISDDWQSTLSVSSEALEQDLRMLVRRGYRGARFSDAVSSPGHGKTVVVTFDDAYSSILRLALPILDAFDLPGTVFVPTRFADGGQVASWKGLETYLQGPHARELEVMSWEELHTLKNRGWEVGSHTVSHPHLPELGDKELLEELVSSRRECEQRLGGPCLSLAYPYGDTNRRVEAAAAAAGYLTAAGLPGGAFHSPAALKWPRVGVYGRDRGWRVKLKLSTSARWLRVAAASGRLPAPSPSCSFSAPPPLPPAGASPRVTVIVPCFNDGELALQAVESIEEPEPVEIVVVDDASSDPASARALDQLSGAGVKVIRHEQNLGLPTARMSGLQATTAPYVFPLDADDLAVPGALTAMAALLEATPNAAVCFGDYAVFGTMNRVFRVPSRLDPFRVAYRNAYPVSSLFRRTTLERVGGWQAVGGELGYEDWNLWMTLAEQGEIGIHWGRGPSLQRRLHGPRMLTDAASRHFSLYRTLRSLHPQLFADVARHRHETDLGPVNRWLYPVMYGFRPPLGLRTRIDEMRARSSRA